MDEMRPREFDEIVRMSVHDLEDVLAIERDSFSSPWPKDYFRQIISDQKYAVPLVAKRDGEVIGYGIAWIKADTFHIGNLAVHRSFRRRKIGQRLLRKLMENGLGRDCHLAALEVRETNQAAITLYSKFGFSPVASRPGYYDDTGENAIIMMTDLRRDVQTSTRFQIVHNVE
jgi:ribosomal-protein-alanine N-acetyltransferase